LVRPLRSFSLASEEVYFEFVRSLFLLKYPDMKLLIFLIELSVICVLVNNYWLSWSSILEAASASSVVVSTSAASSTSGLPLFASFFALSSVSIVIVILSSVVVLRLFVFYIDVINKWS
jgi:hypothetical protein